jgi:hypothetical protein
VQHCLGYDFLTLINLSRLQTDICRIIPAGTQAAPIQADRHYKKAQFKRFDLDQVSVAACTACRLTVEMEGLFGGASPAAFQDGGFATSRQAPNPILIAVLL